MSPVTSKCTTCGHFKVHHFGWAFCEGSSLLLRSCSAVQASSSSIQNPKSKIQNSISSLVSSLFIRLIRVISGSILFLSSLPFIHQPSSINLSSPSLQFKIQNSKFHLFACVFSLHPSYPSYQRFKPLPSPFASLRPLREAIFSSIQNYLIIRLIRVISGSNLFLFSSLGFFSCVLQSCVLLAFHSNFPLTF